ncbi:serine/threonine protein kinase [Phormidium tenue FACHB-886]|nr:serine/threonine protein kinase [Phormidium tenue FACHB-886]
MSQASFSAGNILADRYQIQRLLGKKAGRQTLLARDLTAQTQVVLKLLIFSPEFEWDDLKLFEREAETLRSLDHPAIPRYLDFFELELPHGKGFVLVQSYIEARSLEDQMQQGRTFSLAEIQQLAEALLRILIYLHGQHPPVIHRDIKPSNILLEDRSGHSIGRVYLVDFGSVQTLAAKEGGTITVVGTYGYMPPEQFGGRAVPASDLYSLGATLIYLITGQHPADLPQRDLRIEFEPIARLDAEFTRWLRQMTAPSLSQRFALAEAALANLHQQDKAIITAKSPLAGSRVQVSKSDRRLEILVPPSRKMFKTVQAAIAVAFWLVTAAFVTCFWAVAVVINLQFALLTVPFIFLVWAPFFITGKPILHQLLLHSRLLLDRKRIVFSSELLGQPFLIHQAQTAAVHKLVRSPRFLKLSYSQAYQEVQAKIILWAGTQKFEFGEFLSDPELDWLAQELSDWLGLPIDRE